jgi:long-chain acyl-CoA synthetase
MDADGFVTITDRKKNILITAGGKNITPSNIENAVKDDAMISYCHLHADRRPYPTALVCLDPLRLEAFAKERGLSATTAEALGDDAAVRAHVQAAIDRANARFARFEQIKKFAVLPREFSIDGGELTPTLKVKRRDVEKKYAAILEGMYAHDE